jgi:hypothetical protein
MSLHAVARPSLKGCIAAALAVAMLAAQGVRARAADPPPGDRPGMLACASTSVIVRSRDGRDAEDLCRGAAAATDFFRSLGQSSGLPIELEVVDRLPSEGSPAAVGCYSRIDHRAYVLAYTVLAARQTWLGLPITRELYESVATHEVAHALIACTATDYPLSTQAAEYIAFVAMLSGMRPSFREAVLARYPDADFASEWEITDMAYGLDPIRFGVGAYRHFRREPDPAALIRAILTGAVLGQRHYY